MRKIIGIGETIVDIIFKDDKPVSAKPGGSAFNTMISVGRLQIPCVFISETGNDKLGEMIKKTLIENNISTQYVSNRADIKSSVALAFLDDNNNADYIFYKDYAGQQLKVDFPVIEKNDILVFGSYFSLNPALRHKITALLQLATNNGAIVYYDPNFRKNHIDDLTALMPVLESNFAVSDIVRGSDEDFYHIYGTKNVDTVYNNIAPLCSNLIYTVGNKGVHLRTPGISKYYPVPDIDAVSTVGAGDSFNAGIAFALCKNNISRNELRMLTEEKWDSIIRSGILVATNVCQSYDNYITKEYALELLKSH